MNYIKILLSFSFLFFTTCASKPLIQSELLPSPEISPKSDPKDFAAPIPLIAKSAAVEKSAPTTTLNQVAAESHAVPAEHPTHAADPHAAHAPAAPAVSPDKAISWLKNGNLRFLKGNPRRDGQSHQDISRLATGQAPHSILISCSDSRVPPELVFDQKLGEIFVVRTAGEALDSAAIASIEYAVSHLGSRLLLVMGHTSCGAVKAAMGTLNGGDAGSPSLNKLVADIHPRIKQYTSASPSEYYEKESWSNAKGVAKDLLDRSQIIRDAVATGQLRLSTSLYHTENGLVEWAQ